MAKKISSTRIKFLAASLAAALLTLSLQTARCQVGFANVPLTNGYNFVANAFDDGDNNSLTNVYASSACCTNWPDGSKVYLWNVANQAFGQPATYLTARPGWDTNFHLPPGTGFVIYATAPASVIFVGDVVLKSTNPIVGANGFSLISSAFGGQATLADLQFPATDGDTAYLFNSAAQSFSNASTYFVGYGWFNASGLSTVHGPIINPGQSFFLQHPGPSTNWVQSFTVNRPSSLQSSQAPNVRRLMVAAGKVTLQINNPGGGPCTIQFSTDRVAWTTVATNQIGTTWTGPLPGGAQGYYQVIQQ